MSDDRVSLLLVDDQEANLSALEAVLEPFGENLVKARSGREALERLLQHDFAVVLLDVQMPGMSGFDIAALVRARDRTRHTPILFLTAISQTDQDVRRGYELGAVDYVFKPIAPEILRAKVAVFVELHRRRHQEVAAREELARSNRDLEEFAHVVAHDLQAPLRSVTGHLDLLAKRAVGLDEKARHHVDAAVADADRMKQQIRDLLAYARARNREAEPRPTDAAVVLREVVGRLRVPIEEARAEVTHGPLPVLLVDPTELSQVLQNLVENAVKFHGPVAPKVRVEAERTGDHWRFSVADNGIGIAAKDSERIFGVFQRLHTREEFPGTGIGLALCRRLVEHRGGRIWVESKNGAGSTFHFTLPAVAAPAAVAGARST
jgi:two-component system sensor histidine kinase/response regulator